MSFLSQGVFVTVYVCMCVMAGAYKSLVYQHVWAVTNAGGPCVVHFVHCEQNKKKGYLWQKEQHMGHIYFQQKNAQGGYCL